MSPSLRGRSAEATRSGHVPHRLDGSNDKTRIYSDADVWRYGRAAREFFVVVATLATMGVVFVVASW